MLLENETKNVIKKLAFRRLKSGAQRNLFVGIIISLAACIFTAFIALFTMINLVNTIMTNLISRRKELALLWAVGLDRGQMTRMLNWENGFLTIGSFVASLVLGSIIGKAGCRVLGNMPGFNYVQFKFPFLLTGCYLLVTLVMQIAISRSSVRRLLKGEGIIKQAKAA